LKKKKKRVQYIVGYYFAYVPPIFFPLIHFITFGYYIVKLQFWIL